MKKLIVFTLLALLAFYLIGWFLPGKFEVERKTVIAADRPLIHSYVADLRTWPDWTAWKREDDPECVWTYEGPLQGAGMAYTWDGPELGKGRLELTTSSLSEGVTFDMWFDEAPDPAHGAIRYADVEGGVEVSWSFWGQMSGSPMAYFALVMGPLVGPEFDEGLAGLKAAAEAGLTPRIEAGVKEVLEQIGG